MPTIGTSEHTGNALSFPPMGLFGSSKKVDEALPEQPRILSLGNGVTVPLAPDDYPPILESLRTRSSIQPAPEFHADWMGVRTRIAMLPWAPQELVNTVSHELPIPDDGYRSEAEEYVGLALALERAVDNFQIIEVGAGWAPWVVSGLVGAKERGLKARGIAVEAHPEHARWAIQHAQDNGIDVDFIEGTDTEIIEAFRQSTATMSVLLAAGWHENTVLEFPDVDGMDMGLAVCTMPDSGTDYRGAHLKHREVTAIRLHDLFDALANPMIDLLHIDVQGVEFELLNKEATTVQDHAKLMAVGTHSRLAEGQLQDFYLERGWGIIIDEPCKAIFTMTHPTLAGFTVQDGFQLYENPFLLKN